MRLNTLLGGFACCLMLAGVACGQGFTLDNDGHFEVRAFALSAGDVLGDTNEAIAHWDYIDLTLPGTIVGTSNNGDTFAAYAENTTLTLNYAGGNDFGGDQAWSTIGPGIGGDHFSVLGRAYLAVPVGTWSVAIASDDGRRLGLAGIAGLATPNFIATGGQLENVNPGSGTGTEFVGRNNGTAHDRSIGVFTIDAADLAPDTNLAFLRLDALMFEYQFGDSFELSVKAGNDTTFAGSGDGWRLLNGGGSSGAAGTHGWFLSSEPITTTILTANDDLYWDGGNGNWADAGANAWDVGAVGGPDSANFPALAAPGPFNAFVTVPGSNVEVSGTESALNLTVTDGTVNVTAGSALDIQVNAAVNAAGVINVASGATLAAYELTGTGTVNLTGGTLTTDIPVNFGTLGVDTGSSTLVQPSSSTTTVDTLNLGNQLTVNTNFNADHVVLSGTGTINQPNNTTATFSNVSGAGNLVKTGGGQLTLPTTNSFTGLTTVQNGLITIDVDGALGSPASGTTIANSAQLVLAPSLNYATPEPLTLTGSGISNSGAMRTSGNTTYAGPITLPNHAEIQSDSGLLTLPNSVTIASSRNLTIDGGGDVTISGSIGEAGTGAGIFKTGNGTLRLDGNNSYSGITTVNQGTLVASHSNGLGTSAAGTTVNSATLALAGVVTGEPLDVRNGGTLQAIGGVNLTTGATNFSGSSTIEAATATDSLTLTNLSVSNLTNLTFAGDGEVTVNNGFGAVPASNVVKAGAGTTTLAGANSYSGTTEVQAGNLIATDDSALGLASTGTTVVAGATLGFAGDLTIAEPITANGTGVAGRAGALVNLSGNTVITSNLTAELENYGSLGVGAEAGSLTINGNVDLQHSQLKLDGAGDLTINGVIGGVGFIADVVNADQLNAFAYDVTGISGDQTIGNVGDGSGSGGLLGLTPISHILIDGPDRIDYRDDNDFRNGDAGLLAQGFATSLDGLPGLNQNDNFATMFAGQIVIPDLNGGNPYSVEFGTNRGDDPVQIYLDLNQDGVFDHGQGSNFDPSGVSGPFGEMVLNVDCCGSGWQTISLAPGTYEFAAVHLERGGGSRVEPTIDLTLDGLGRRTISPGSVSQNGLFQYVIEGSHANSISKSGDGTTILSGANTYDGQTSVNAGTLVAANNQALGLATTGTQIASGASLGISGGVTVAEPLTVAGTGDAVNNRSGAIVNLGGDNALTGPITANADYSIGADAGSLVISGPLDATGSGATITKSGSGRVILTGSHTHPGDLTVTNGSLLINGDYAGGGTFLVTAGVLGGSGSISNGTIVTGGGYFSPGNSPGAMTVANLTLDSSPYLWELYDASQPGPGTNAWDLVTITNNLTVNPGGSLEVLGLQSLLPTPNGTAGVPIGLDITRGAVTGPFDVLILAPGASLTGISSLLDLPISAGNLAPYGHFVPSLTNGGSTLQLSFVSVPEPSTYVLLFLTLVTVLGYRRRA